MTRADILLGEINTSIRASQSNYLLTHPTSGSIYNFFYSGVDNGLYWMVSYDSGFSWSAKVLVKAVANNSLYSVWFDRWTPGDTGLVVHIAYAEATGDDVLYRPFDISTETLGTETTIFAGTSTGSVANMCVSITKAIGGNLYCLFDIDGGTETGFYRSTDAGGTWGSLSNTAEGGDYFLLAPGFAADTQDILCIFWDRSASEISRKIYDDSGDSWAETSISTGMTSIANTTSASQFSISVDDANNKILLAAWTNRNTVNADLKFWTIDESSITAGTDVVLNSGGNQCSCALSLVVSSSTIYCFYIGKADGSETIGSSVGVYYKTSADGGTTWSAETTASSLSRNYDYLFTNPVVGDTTGKFFAAYELQTTALDELLISALLPSGGGGSVTSPMFGAGVIQ